MSKMMPEIPRWRLPRGSTMTGLYIVLAVLTVVVVWASLTGNAFGAYAAAYISTALTVFGLIDLVRKLRKRRPLRRTVPVLVAGLIMGLFMNVGMVLGWSVYLAFMIGQVFTVGLVVWLVSSDQEAEQTA